MMMKIAALLVLAIISYCNGVELNLCKKAVTGMSCEMMCHFHPNGDQMVKISRNMEEITECENSTSCIISSPKYTDASVHWMEHGDMGMIHFTINKLDIERDEYDWSCSYGKNESEKETLKIISKPSTCQLVKVPATDKTNATLQCQVNCTYPAAEVAVKLYVDGKKSMETAVKTEDGNSGCTSTKETNLVYTWPMAADTMVQYTCDCSVKAIGWTDSDMIGMKKQVEGFATTTIVAIVIVVVVVIIAVIIAIILIRKKRNSKGGARLATEAEGEREEL